MHHTMLRFGPRTLLKLRDQGRIIKMLTLFNGLYDCALRSARPTQWVARLAMFISLIFRQWNNQNSYAFRMSSLPLP